jgi:hypothetical protein
MTALPGPRDLSTLASWPSRGNRRKLEALWLEALERRGTEDPAAEPPDEAPESLGAAIDQFNDRRFWECHETLEEVWLETPYPLRFFYHAIIKTAVGFHHMSRHNLHGAETKICDGVRLLQLFQPKFLDVRTDALLGDGSVWLERLGERRAGVLSWEDLDAIPRPVIKKTP